MLEVSGHLKQLVGFQLTTAVMATSINATKRNNKHLMYIIMHSGYKKICLKKLL